jgi:2-polyprenyl-3-methyl-5-hydroxy-6-metoxy-1,4-benzoquinol methylase
MNTLIQSQAASEIIDSRKPCEVCGGTDAAVYKHCGTGPQPIVKCHRCGLVYRDELISDREYREESSRDPLVFRDPSYLKNREKSRLNLILDEIGANKSGRKILDIGCGHGFLLHEAKSRGYDASGVDLHKSSVKYAREVLGLNVLAGEIEAAAYPSDFFDVIVMSEVLEHMLHPGRALSEVNRILKQDGFVYIVVPNIDSVSAKTNFQWWSRYHFYFFGADTLEKMLKINGFSVRKLIINPHLAPASGKRIVCRRFRRVLRLARRLLSFSLARNLITKIGAGSLTVIAEKKEANFEHLDS